MAASIVFFGTSIFARHHLEALMKDDQFDVVGVVSQPDKASGRKLQVRPSPVKILAQENSLPVLTDLKKEDSLRKLRSFNAEAAVVVAFGQILSQDILDLYSQKIVNIHGSLLPRWRGAAPIQRAIMKGDKETGVSLQIVVKELDAGDILGERRVAITEDMTAVELNDILKVLGVDLLSIELPQYLRGNLKSKPQTSEGITYAHKIKKSESQLIWNCSAEELYNKHKGLSLDSGVFCLRDSKKLKFHKMKLVKKDIQDEVYSEAGQVLSIDQNSFTVACKKGALQIFKVQPESKSQMCAGDYSRGYHLAIGDKFE